jgi:hypothetical protein
MAGVTDKYWIEAKKATGVWEPIESSWELQHPITNLFSAHDVAIALATRFVGSTFRVYKEGSPLQNGGRAFRIPLKEYTVLQVLEAKGRANTSYTMVPAHFEPPSIHQLKESPINTDDWDSVELKKK